MSSLPEEHWRETEKLARRVSKDKLTEWLLFSGYFPEPYVLPPCFEVQNFPLQSSKFSFNPGNNKPTSSKLISISFPKSSIADRNFSIIDPIIYHDIIFDLVANYDQILNLLFAQDQRIFSYSFPIAVSSSNDWGLSKLRAGRSIYEFLEMAENDLVAEAHKYKVVLIIDIKNFYPSIYTHLLAHALHNPLSERDYQNYSLFGNRLDCYFQYANSRKTNGIPIGPIVSDLASEILLAWVDTCISTTLSTHGITFEAVRFKDDYRVLCSSNDEAEKVLRIVRKELMKQNLFVNEEKTHIENLPGGLYRKWTREYEAVTLRNVNPITFKIFQRTYLKLLDIDKDHPGTGMINKFLAELVDDHYRLKLKFTDKETIKAASLLLLLRNSFPRALPQVLGILELLLEEVNRTIKDEINSEVLGIFRDEEDYLYDSIWSYYFLVKQNARLPKVCDLLTNNLFLSVHKNSQNFFTDGLINGMCLFKPINPNDKKLVQYLDVFP
jgi:hypothetical protein